jgi:hypothetical protein
MALNLFDTRFLIDMVIEIDKSSRTFLRDTFFKGSQQFDTKYIEFDKITGKRRVAAFVNTLVEGKVVDRPGSSRKVMEPAHINEKIATTADDFLQAQAGTTMYPGGQTPAARAALQLGKDLKNLNDMCTRNEELQCSQILHTGVLTIRGDGVDNQVTYGVPANQTITLTGIALWTDKVNSTPRTDLIGWVNRVSQSSGVVPNTMVLGLDAGVAFTEHPTIKDKFNMLKVDQGIIKPELLPNGVTYLGQYRDIGIQLDMFTYSEWYIDPADGVEKPMVALDKIILGNSNSTESGLKLYGAISDMKALTWATPRFSKSWEEEDPSVRWLNIKSSPLMALALPESILCAKVK